MSDLFDHAHQKNLSGSDLFGKGAIHPMVQRAIAGAVAEVDVKQIIITRQFTPAQRVQQGCSITDLANSVVAFCQNQREHSNV